MKGTGERQRCCITPSVTLRRSSGFPTDSAKRIAVRRMCRGSQGCGSPTVLSLRWRLFIRRTSSMTRVFYNSPAEVARHGKGGAEAPPSWSKKPVLLPACGKQVEEGKHRRKGRRDVREGRGGQDPPSACGLRARQNPVACQEPVGTGRSVDLDRQRYEVESENPDKHDDGDVDQERPQRRRRAPDKEGEDKRHRPELAADVHDREDAGPQLHRHVAACVLNRVPHLVGGHADPCDGTTPEVVLGESDDFVPRVVVVRELPGHGLHLNVAEAVTVEYHPRRLLTGEAARAPLFRVLRVGTSHPQGSCPGYEHADDHNQYVTAEATWYEQRVSS